MTDLEKALSAVSAQAGKKVQEKRAGEYGIAIKDGGHVTKPSEWENVSDDEFLDPVNYRYPCPDADQTRSAASYWGQEKNQEQYSSEERGIITKRLEKMEKKFKIGLSAEAQVGDYAKAAVSLDQIRDKIYSQVMPSPRRYNCRMSTWWMSTRIMPSFRETGNISNSLFPSTATRSSSETRSRSKRITFP